MMMIKNLPPLGGWRGPKTSIIMVMLDLLLLLSSIQSSYAFTFPTSSSDDSESDEDSKVVKLTADNFYAETYNQRVFIEFYDPM